MSSKLPNWSEITAIFGGRFDPPHLGHREAVRGLFKNPGIRRVFIVPTASPPHKPTWASAEQRAEMTELNFKPTLVDPYPFDVEIDYRELNRARIQPNIPSYSIDTIQELTPLFRNQLAFVIGTDQLEQLHTWHRFDDLLTLCHWIVLLRKPEGEDLAHRVLQQWAASGMVCQTKQSHTWQIRKSGKTFLTLVSTDAPFISSSAIRESIARSGNPPKNTISEEILSYLKVHHLYGI